LLLSIILYCVVDYINLQMVARRDMLPRRRSI